MLYSWPQLTAMIHLDQLSFTHPGDLPALDGISLQIRPGERLALIGPNGSGKSTLARCLNGLHRPSSGHVLVDGLSTRDPESLFQIRRRVGMVFQNPDDQLVSTKIDTELAFGLENIGLAHAEMHQRVEEILRDFQLAPFRERAPHQLSGGEKQRLAIAATVALRPAYLVLDEPTALLDPQGRAAINALLDRLHRAYGMATLHITQLPGEAALAERILVLHQGRLLYDGPPEDIFARPHRLQAIGLDAPFPCAVAADLALPGGPYLTMESLAEGLRPRLPPAPSPVLPPPASPAPAKMATEHLSHVYDAALPTCHTALEDISLVLPQGGVLALIGPSGSGKTTLAQHFNALLKPHRGRVLLEGRDIWSDDRQTQLRRRVGLVFQFPEFQLFEETVALDVAFGPRNLGFTKDRVGALVHRALEQVGLPEAEFGHRPPLSLSGGERRRAALAGVLAMDPDVLVLDEPTAGLDPGAAGDLQSLFEQMRQAGKSLVLISHDMDLVAELSTHIAVLADGRLQLYAPTREGLTNPSFAELAGLEPPAAVRLLRLLEEGGAGPLPPWIRTREVLAHFTP